jgi:hypothetical protein
MSVSEPGGARKIARRAFHQRKSFPIAAVLAVYLVSYSILSANGQYRARPSGEHRFAFGLAMTDLSLWCPAGMSWERRKSDSGEYIVDADQVGWLFLPLIAADRQWIHRTGHYFEPWDE